MQAVAERCSSVCSVLIFHFKSHGTSRAIGRDRMVKSERVKYNYVCTMFKIYNIAKKTLHRVTCNKYRIVGKWYSLKHNYTKLAKCQSRSKKQNVCWLKYVKGMLSKHMLSIYTTSVIMVFLFCCLEH